MNATESANSEGNTEVPRVRFAPSPTGYLHIGGARTALFAWLWARQNGGQFVLRIEDTDAARNTGESVDAILRSLTWLGLDWDEGPFYQSERAHVYREYAEKLVRIGCAYRCYCTKEELDVLREEQRARNPKQPFRYPRVWRDRTDFPTDKPYVIRFKSPLTGTTGWVDTVRGRIDVPNDQQQDFILLRADGVPLYNFACVVDDHLMRINLVVRGDDHLVNTPPQILIYQALGLAAPKFAHLPMILAPNGEKLSKRHAAVSVLEYQEKGYLPDGVLNYLARLGWSHGDQEIFTRQELIEKFNWKHVGKTGSRYDSKKFLHVQSEHLRNTPLATLASEVIPFLHERGLNLDGPKDPRILRSLPPLLPRAQTLADLAESMDYVFREPPLVDPKAHSKFLRKERAPMLRELADVVAQATPFEQETLEAAVGSWLDAKGMHLKEVAQPARVALTGLTRSPGLYELMMMLGQELVLTRLRRAASVAETAER